MNTVFSKGRRSSLGSGGGADLSGGRSEVRPLGQWTASVHGPLKSSGEEEG